MTLRLYSTGNEDKDADLISGMEISAAFSTALFRTVTETMEKRTSGKKAMVPNPSPRGWWKRRH